jgi:hypothetical protein
MSQLNAYVRATVTVKVRAAPLLNPLTPNDLRRRRGVSPLKIKIPSKNMRKNQEIQQLFIQFIMYGSSYMFRHHIVIIRERS